MPGEPAVSRPLPSLLLVEDEPELVELALRALQSDFRVFPAHSVADAELLLAARSYDVIVCDHMLPGELGFDFLIRVQDMMPKTRRILVTGYTNPEFISRSIGIAGLSACLVKPVRASDLRDAALASLAS
jgi:response regulator RpfG family c-di-GMP phosphodiesterase